MYKKTVTSLLLFLGALFQAQKHLPLIPYPQKIEVQQGAFTLPTIFTFDQGIDFNKFKVYQNYLKHEGFDSKISKQKQGNTISFQLLPPGISTEKNYHQLEISNNGIVIKSNSEAGYFLGFQTLLQLIQHAKDRKLPYLTIEDYSKFDYRGMHLDVCRHFFTVDEVKQYIDYLATYKMNKFHWHLTDDQGWRIEIKKYPKLTEIGGYRNGSMIGAYSDMKFDDIRYGGFYTQEQIKEVVAYAKERYVDVIPEIEMPGHAVAAIAAYPQLSCVNEQVEVGKKWGVEDNIMCPTEYTFDFLQNVLDEVITLFPYQYIHIGGDEAPKVYWKNSAFVQNKIKELGLKDNHEMQSYFIKRIEKYLNAKGKQIIGWDEILDGGLAPNATVMSWQGIEGGIKAVQLGNKAIMTPTSTNYFDYYQGNPETEPLAFGGDTRLHNVYAFNPIPKSLTSEQAQNIWGTQANLWTEYILDFPHVQHMIFPRIMALSELAWGTSKPNQYNEFENRVLEHFKTLDKKGIRYSKAIFEIRDDVKLKDHSTIQYTLSTAKNPENIRFTTDGTEPNPNSEKYLRPLSITKSQQIKSAYFENGERKSPINSKEFFFSKATGKPITLVSEPAEAYSVGGAKSLVDGLMGSIKNHGKSWLGFSGKDCIATIDLLKNENISNIKLNTLDRQGSWIHLPSEIIIYISQDQKTFKTIKTISQQEIQKSNGQVDIQFEKQNARYVKVEIKNAGIIPAGKDGAGHGAWLFVDEIRIF